MAPGTKSALAGSAVSCVTGFDLHTLIGDLGHAVGILSGAASIAWVIYSFVQSRKNKQ